MTGMKKESACLWLALCCILLAPLFQSPAIAEDWPTFHHDIVHSGWTNCTGPIEDTVAWKYHIGSPIHASPVVVGDRLFVGAGDGKMYCFDKHNGSLLWSCQTGKSTDGIVSTATVADGNVIFGSMDGQLYSLNEQNGTILWTHGFDAWVKSNPVVVNGSVYINSAIIQSDSYHSYEVNFFGSFFESNGTFEWMTDLFSMIDSSPAFHNDILFVGTGPSTDFSWHGGLIALNAEDGSVLWRFSAGAGQNYANIDSTPAIADGKIYFSGTDGTLYCIWESNGTEIWRCKGSFMESSPAVYDGKIYIESNDNFSHFQISALDSETGSVIWNFPTLGIKYWTIYGFSSPAIANGIIYFGSTDGYVYALTASDGDLLWKYATNGAIESSPAVSDGMMYIGSFDGFLYAFGPNLPPTASFDVPLEAAYTNYCVTLNGTNSTDPDANTVAQYYFDFGDGNNSGWVGMALVEHKYTKKGNYTASLRVKDIHGAESDNVANITISVVNHPPPKQKIIPTPNFYSSIGPMIGLFLVVTIIIVIVSLAVSRPQKTMADVPLGDPIPEQVQETRTPLQHHPMHGGKTLKLAGYILAAFGAMWLIFGIMANAQFMTGPLVDNAGIIGVILAMIGGALIGLGRKMVS